MGEGGARRKRVDPIVVVAAMGVLLFGGLTWWFTRHQPPEEDLIALPLPASDAGPVGGADLADAGPADEDAEPDPIQSKQPRTRRGKLVKRELEKKRLAQAGGGSGGGATGLSVVLMGDAAAQRAFTRKLTGARVSRDASEGWLVTLKTQSGGSDESAWVKCSATIAELPQKKLASALSARADVAGEGTTRDELVRDASDACYSSLAQDVSGWLRAHR